MVVHLARPTFVRTMQTKLVCTHNAVKAAMADENHTERFQMRVPAEFLAKIDEWRRQQPDLPNRSEAIRRLVEQALKQQ